MPIRKNSTLTRTARKSDSTTETVSKAYQNASRMMRDSGYGLKSKVEVAVEPNLPFMGYSMPLPKGYRIVVSGGAVGSELLEGLLTHEMSHIYRMENNHPSHDADTIQEAIDKIGQSLGEDYQQKIVHDLLNDIQDLYADDISMKVIRKDPTIQPGQLTQFLQDWVKDEPVKSGDPRQDRWMNASIMVHNARAIGQMTRHKIEDTGGKAAESNKKFLSRMPPKATAQFSFFLNLMINLRENMTRDEYQRLLADYLNRFLEIAEKN
jgi:hypothetical protein